MTCLLILVAVILARTAVRVSRQAPDAIRIDVHHHVHMPPGSGERWRDPDITKRVPAPNVVPFRPWRNAS